jgi:hypothetical protein
MAAASSLQQPRHASTTARRDESLIKITVEGGWSCHLTRLHSGTWACFLHVRHKHAGPWHPRPRYKSSGSVHFAKRCTEGEAILLAEAALLDELKRLRSIEFVTVLPAGVA